VNLSIGSGFERCLGSLDTCLSCNHYSVGPVDFVLAEFGTPTPIVELVEHILLGLDIIEQLCTRGVREL